MSDLTVQLHITSIRSRGRTGGAIFSGITESRQSYVAKCDYRLLPDASVIYKGQIWTITGPVTLRSAFVRSSDLLRHEQVIEATHAELLRPAGRNIIAWIANSSDCAGIGQVKAQKLYDRFGPELMDRIEAFDMAALGQVVSAYSDERRHRFQSQTRHLFRSQTHHSSPWLPPGTNVCSHRGCLGGCIWVRNRMCSTSQSPRN